MNVKHGKIIPHAREAFRSCFVSPKLIKPRVKTVEGIQIPTAPLVFDREIDLIGISTHCSFLNNGWQNQTDVLDPDVIVESVYIMFNKDVLKFDTCTMPYFNFIPSIDGDYRRQVLYAESNELVLDSSTRTIENKKLSGELVDISEGLYKVKLRIVLGGEVRTDTGKVVVYGRNLEFFTICDSKTDNWIFDPDTYKTRKLVTELNKGKLLGYDISAIRRKIKEK